MSDILINDIPEKTFSTLVQLAESAVLSVEKFAGQLVLDHVANSLVAAGDVDICEFQEAVDSYLRIFEDQAVHLMSDNGTRYVVVSAAAYQRLAQRN